MQGFTSCWRLVDWQKDLASRVSSILMELCELEVFLLSWPGPSQSSSLESSPGKYCSGRSCHCTGGHFLWIDWYVNKWEVVFVFWKPLNPQKLYWILQWPPKWKIFTTTKNFTFLPGRWFSSKKNTSRSLGGTKQFFWGGTQGLCHFFHNLTLRKRDRLNREIM